MDGIEVRRHLIGRGPVVEIVLDLPKALNALDTVMLVRFAQTCAELAPDTGVRAVVLTAPPGTAPSAPRRRPARNGG